VAVELGDFFLDSVEQTLGDAVYRTDGNVSCWGNSAPLVNDFYFTSKGYGLCVDRKYFDSALLATAQAAGAQLYMGASFHGCRRNVQKNHWEIDMVTAGTGTSTHTSKYILDCSGRRATVAFALGIERYHYDNLFAFAQRFVTDSGRDQDTYTRIEACSDGWWYSNKLPSSTRHLKQESTQQVERVVVFHTDKDSKQAKQAANTQGFVELLAQSPQLAEYVRHAEFKPVGRVRGAAAGSERLSKFCGDGWLAVGDAAQSYDPLSSQGIYKALSSGSMAAQMVHYALSDSNKDTFFIKRYAQEQTRLWNEYVQQRDHYYTSEQRWSNHLFWTRRHANKRVAANTTGKGTL